MNSRTVQKPAGDGNGVGKIRWDISGALEVFYGRSKEQRGGQVRREAAQHWREPPAEAEAAGPGEARRRSTGEGRAELWKETRSRGRGIRIWGRGW